jgi:two-component system chemotaxis response regulator CheB
MPDVVSMDFYMPEMDGVEATRIIMRDSPVPIVIVSGFYDPTEVTMSFSILEAGALTILPKPFGPMHPEFNQTARTYRNTLKMMSAVNVSKNPRRTERSPVVARRQSTPAPERSRSTPKIIAIGASAGGPQAIEAILKGLPASLPVPVLIVQHIDTHFAAGYCDWLNTTSAVPVHVAIHGEIMLPGHVYLPPGDHHLGLERENIISVTKSPPEKGLRPAVSYLFKNVNAVYGGNSVCILLSGMGTDGAAELKILRDAGALTIAQDESSSLVHGMPGEAIRLGGAVEILSPVEIAHKIIEIVKPVK